MKIQFDPNLDFQKQAIDSVAGVFEGQEICQTNFTVAPLQYTTQQVISGMENNLGIGNRLKLLPEDIHKNIRKIQLNLISAMVGVNLLSWCRLSPSRKE